MHCNNEQRIDRRQDGAIGELSTMARCMRGVACAFALWTVVVLSLWPITADAQDPGARRASAYVAQQDKINAWTVGLAAGLIEGAPLRLAAEMARVVDDRENLHVLPIVTR